MPMIETINLTKKYGELMALNNLNLSINDGSCYGFIGPNGAGKTTTIKILATLLKPTWGEGRINGKVIGYQNAQIRPLIGSILQIVGILGRDIGVAVLLSPHTLQHEPGVMTTKGERLGDGRVDIIRRR